MRSTSSKNIAKVEEAKQMLDAELKRMAAAEDTLNASVAEFERERLNDTKVSNDDKQNTSSACANNRMEWHHHVTSHHTSHDIMC